MIAGRPAMFRRTSATAIKPGFDLACVLIFCGDISLNPGSKCQYPCGLCLQAVRSNQRGVQCDFCDVWYHVKCMKMNTQIYQALANSSCIWECADCDFPNFSGSLFDSPNTVQVTNHFWPLSPKSLSSEMLSMSNADESSIGHPQHSSSPSLQPTTTNKKPEQNRTLLGRRKLTVLVINHQSILAKNHLTAKLMADTKPNIIIGTETWLTATHNTGEILISDSYNIERRDRETDAHGGVLIAAKKNLTISMEYELETDCEILWCRLQIAGRKTLHIGAYYRPHEHDEKSCAELERSLSLINDHHHLRLGGDFNFPGWDWANHTVMQCNYPALHHRFGDILDDKGLVQLVDRPTRLENTLDLAISNNPNSIENISVIPGVSDHDCPFICIDLYPIRHKQTSRKIPLYKRAKWDNFSEELSADIGVILDNEDNLTTNDLWVKLKEAINKEPEKHILHKVCKSKDNLPWITTKIRKMIKKRERLIIRKKTPSTIATRK